MDDNLRRKLKRLGVVKGFRNLQTQSPESTRPQQAGKGLPGELQETAHGPVWTVQQHYPGATQHGRYPLAALNDLPSDAQRLLCDPVLGPRPAFLDTETTGLAGGAGTLAFMIGLGIWQEEQLTLYQVFLRDPDEEAAAMRYLDTLLQETTGLVTFNGQTFDLPLLESRFILQRLPPRWRTLPHLDLLRVARRLWRDHLPSRRLSYLEEHVLNVRRTDDDLPGHVIPMVYRHYLRHGETHEIRRIFYHNEIDILSLVTLLTHAGRLIHKPATNTPQATEWVGIGRVYADAERVDDAEQAWQQALEEDTLPADVAARLWRKMALRHKRAERWEQAMALWESWARRQPWAVEPLVERAKYYEWQVKALPPALDATERALQRADTWPKGLSRQKKIAELKHRQDRLQRKLDARLDSPEQ
jgi:uncharacterized protein YprB with RNaseH-like and TPR domain